MFLMTWQRGMKSLSTPSCLSQLDPRFAELNQIYIWFLAEAESGPCSLGLKTLCPQVKAIRVSKAVHEEHY
jgi:hypothetical protein